MRLLNYVLWLTAIILSFYLLIVGKNLLIPLILALFIWYLINVLTVVFGHLSLRGKHLPRGIAFAFSILAILAILSSTVNLITNNITQVVTEASTYQENLDSLIVRGIKLFRLDKLTIWEVEELSTRIHDTTLVELQNVSDEKDSGQLIDSDVARPEITKPTFPSINKLFAELNFALIISKVAGVLTDFLNSAGIILVYLIFLFIEQGYFRKKLNALVPDLKRRSDINKILDKIGHDTRKYVGIKTLVSLMTALFSYVIMMLIGLDFAEFWAFMIFILNFIPFIGSIIATILPALLAIIQFGTFTPFFIVAGGVTAVQFIVANIVEPRLMGQSLNLSPLVIFLSLALWGAMWGIAGMFLCVPLTVICMIILSHFPQTRPIAIVLSKDGQIRK